MSIIKALVTKFGVTPGHTEPDGPADAVDRANDPLYTQPDAAKDSSSNGGKK